jgi:hypothetical protein
MPRMKTMKPDPAQPSLPLPRTQSEKSRVAWERFFDRIEKAKPRRRIT